MKCPNCDGTGEMTLTVTEYGKTEVKTHKGDCVSCDGTGKVTAKRKAQIDFENNMWCECGNPSGESNFFDDGQHPEVHKHHYRCVDCDKVTQVG